MVTALHCLPSLFTARRRSPSPFTIHNHLWPLTAALHCSSSIVTVRRRISPFAVAFGCSPPLFIVHRRSSLFAVALHCSTSSSSSSMVVVAFYFSLLLFTMYLPSLFDLLSLLPPLLVSFNIVCRVSSFLDLHFAPSSSYSPCLANKCIVAWSLIWSQLW